MHECADLTFGESPFRNQQVVDFAVKNVLGVDRISIPADLHHLCVGIVIYPDGLAGLNPFSVHVQTMLIVCTVDKGDIVPFAVAQWNVRITPAYVLSPSTFFIPAQKLQASIFENGKYIVDVGQPVTRPAFGHDGAPIHSANPCGHGKFTVRVAKLQMLLMLDCHPAINCVDA